MSDEAFDGAAHALRAATRVVAMTGAGVSAESGIATFRDESYPEALWAQYDPLELATPEAFARDPELVTRWYEWRMDRCAACEPNAGHRALADLERVLAEQGRSFTLLTQNVDGLHHEAGSERVHELHGSIRRWRCVECGRDHGMPKLPFASRPLRCGCPARGALRPGVVWFGEALPGEAMEAAGRAAAECDVFLSIGTSAVVYPAAGFATAARARGATVIEVNRERTPLTPAVDFALCGLAGEILPRLVTRAMG